MQHTTALLLSVFIALSTGLYIGGDIGTQLTSTFLFLNHNYSVSTETQITIKQVNFVSQNGGQVTPFLAVYTSGSETVGSSFKLLLKGDPITAPSNSVVNSEFIANYHFFPTVTLRAGQTLVVGAYQTASIIKFGANLGTTLNTLIWSGDLVPAVGAIFPVTPNYIFNFREYRFNIDIFPVSTTVIRSRLVLPAVSLSERADTVAGVTNIFITSNYTATNCDTLVTFSRVRIVTSGGGLVTPIIALYTGTVPTSGTSYTLLVKGDPVLTSLDIVPFTVGGEPFCILLSAGQTIVAGTFQPNIIQSAWNSQIISINLSGSYSLLLQGDPIQVPANFVMSGLTSVLCAGEV